MLKKYKYVFYILLYIKMYSQITNINYDKNVPPLQPIRVGDCLVDGNLSVQGRNISRAPLIVVPTGQTIQKPVLIADRVFTVNGVATLDYTPVGLTGSYIPRAYASIIDPVLSAANNACFVIINSVSTTQIVASIYRVQAGVTELYNVSGVLVDFLVIGSQA